MRRLHLLALCIASAMPASPAGATVITPNVFTDDDNVNGNCTLREAVEAANTNAAVDDCPAGEPAPVVDQIVMAAGSFVITLPDPVEITEDLDIAGSGQGSSDLSGTGGDGLLRIPFGSDPEVTLSGLTLHDSHRNNGGGACLLVASGSVEVTDVTFERCSTGNLADGGAIINTRAEITLTRVTLRDNEAGLDGGAIAAHFSNTTLIDSVVIGNRVEPLTGIRYGGGIFQHMGRLTVSNTLIAGNRSSIGGGIASRGSMVTLTDVTLDRNFATTYGGGIYEIDESTLNVVRTTISRNRSDDQGGGLRMTSGELFLEDSTVSLNRALEGGGLFSDVGLVHLLHTTMAHNVASQGAAIYNRQPASGVLLTNSLILGSCDTPLALPTSFGGNLESPGDTCGLDQPDDQPGVAAPGLTALADHGGPTETHLLLPGSPAIDTAPAGDCTATGQRGNVRPIDGDGGGGAECDVGSVEVMLGETAPIFADGFEGGDTLSWSETAPAI